MSIRFTIAAQLELEAAREWYEGRAPGLGSKFVDSVREAVAKIEAMPHAWQRLGTRARRYRLDSFPYGIAYEVRSDDIIIAAIGHLRRRPAYWQSRVTKPKS